MSKVPFCKRDLLWFIAPRTKGRIALVFFVLFAVSLSIKITVRLVRHFHDRAVRAAEVNRAQEEEQEKALKIQQMRDSIRAVLRGAAERERSKQTGSSTQLGSEAIPNVLHYALGSQYIIENGYGKMAEELGRAVIESWLPDAAVTAVSTRQDANEDENGEFVTDPHEPWSSVVRVDITVGAEFYYVELTLHVEAIEDSESVVRVASHRVVKRHIKSIELPVPDKLPKEP